MSIEVIPSYGALGAEIRGLDVSRPIDDARFAELEAAWRRYIVLLFRGQSLTANGLIAFGRRFGELHVTKGLAYGDKPAGTAPEIEIISNQSEDAVPADARPSAEATWHTDMSMFEKPAAASILYCVEAPSGQGQTHFANLYMAYETLPQKLREQIMGRRSLHDAAYTAMGELRAGYRPSNDPAKGPGTYHPIVRTHPQTGRESLFLGRKGYGYIEGLGADESAELLKNLWAHMTRPEFVWSHDWCSGDLVLWDNRCCAHMRSAFNPALKRRLLRVATIGERPFYRPQAQLKF
ncbi:TauD/TfdA family dioxygenase [Limibacillus sp. MBR-115]|jgi:taurine dioxygenase|uniref:TauD/TfdA dioxygenase family protein n=1 Tax=Limibacillus sp. MBR-115 TaxID=3156465 RepID=UPI00339A7C91